MMWRSRKEKRGQTLLPQVSVPRISQGTDEQNVRQLRIEGGVYDGYHKFSN